MGSSPYCYPQLNGLGPDQWAIPHFGAQPSGLRQSVSGETSPGYWSQVPSSVSSGSIGGRSTVPGILPSSPDNAFPYPQSQMPWASQRSMSFGHIEGMPQYQQFSLGQPPLGVGSSYSFPMQLNSSSRSVDSTSLPENIPAALPSTLSSQMQSSNYPVPPAWDQYHTQSQPHQYSPDSSRVSFNTAQWSVPLDGVDRVEGESQHQSQQR